MPRTDSSEDHDKRRGAGIWIPLSTSALSTLAVLTLGYALGFAPASADGGRAPSTSQERIGEARDLADLRARLDAVQRRQEFIETQVVSELRSISAQLSEMRERLARLEGGR